MAKKTKNQADRYVKVMRPGYEGRSFKVVKETINEYTILVDGAWKTFFKVHCIADRASNFKADLEKKQKAQSIGLARQK